MAELATLARPYANAVFEIAKGDGDLDRWSRMLKLLGAAAREPAVRVLLDSPDIPDEQKAYRLADAFRDELNDRARKFLNVLADNKRLPLLPEIAEQYEAARAEEEKTLDVEVISALPLSGEQETRLADALRQKFERDVALTSRVDQELVGGVIVRAGDTVIDGSVRGRLEKLAETLQRT